MLDGDDVAGPVAPVGRGGPARRRHAGAQPVGVVGEANARRPASVAAAGGAPVVAHQQAARVVGQGVGQGPLRVGEVLDGAHARLRVAAGARERAPVHVQRGLQTGVVVADLNDPPVRVHVLDQAAGGVVDGPRDVAQRVGDGRAAVHGVEVARLHPAQGVDDAHRPPGLVVLVAGDPARPAHGRHELVGVVVAEAAHAVDRVLGLRNAPAPVVDPPEGARPGGVAGRDAPAPVVADPAPLARGPHLADQLGVGVVAQLGAPAHRAPHPGHAPALVVVVAHTAAAGAADAHRPPRRVPLDAGAPARGVDELHRPSAPVVGGGRLRPVGSDGGHPPPPLVHPHRCRTRRAAGRDLPAGVGVALEGAHPGRVRGPARPPEPVVVARPHPAARVDGLPQPGHGVVGELPHGAVGQPHAADIAQVVQLLLHPAPQRVDRRGRLAVLPVLQGGARPQGVHHRPQPPGGGVLVRPGRAVGVHAAGQQARGVVGEARRGPRGHDQLHGPPGAVAHHPRGVPRRVGGGHQVAVLVVGEARPHPGRVGDLQQQGPVPHHVGAPALAVDDPRGLGLPALVGHGGAGHLGAVLQGDHVRQAVVLVVDQSRHGPRRRQLDHQAAALVELAHGPPALPVLGHDLVAPPVVGHGGAVAVGVGHAQQAAAGVGHPRVRPAPVRIRHRGHPPGQVGEARHPPEPGGLRGHPARLVVGVAGLDHAVGVDHRADQAAVLVPLVAARPQRARGLHQPPAFVVAVLHPPPVVGPHRGDEVPVPLHGDLVAAHMADPHQPGAVVVEQDGGALGQGERRRPPRAGELPPGPGVVRHRPAVLAARQPEVLVLGAVEALPQAGEDDLAPVRQRPGGPLRLEAQPASVQRRPPGPVPTGPAAQRGVGADPAQQRRPALEAQVLLVLHEIAGRRVDRVVRESRRRRVALRLHRRDLQLRALLGDPVGLQARRDRGVRHRRDHPGSAGRLEILRHHVRARAVVVIRRDVIVEPHQDLVARQLTPLALGPEVLHPAGQRRGRAADLVGRRPLLGGEAAQIIGQRRRHPGRGRAHELLARALGRGLVGLDHPLHGLGLGRVRVAVEQMKEIDGLAELLQIRARIPLGLPLPGGVDPGLLRLRIGLQIPDPLGHVPQTTRQQPGVAVGRIDIAGPQLRVVALEVRAVRGSAAGAPPDLALHRARRGVELGGQIGTDRVIPHHVRCRVQIIQAQVAHTGPPPGRLREVRSP